MNKSKPCQIGSKILFGHMLTTIWTRYLDNHNNKKKVTHESLLDLCENKMKKIFTQIFYFLKEKKMVYQ